MRWSESGLSKGCHNHGLGRLLCFSVTIASVHNCWTRYLVGSFSITLIIVAYSAGLSYGLRMRKSLRATMPFSRTPPLYHVYRTGSLLH